MTACWYVRWFCGMKQIFKADGTVGVKLFGLAPMIYRDACAACVAMHAVVSDEFYTTNAALIAVVVISLNPVIKKVAHGAKVGGECNAACFVATCLGYGLALVACGAHHFFYRVTIYVMILGVIVAMAAHIHFVATRRNQEASAYIVFATIVWFF